MIITSLLDTDLYKYTMMQVVFHRFPRETRARFDFKCRTKGVSLEAIVGDLRREVVSMGGLSLTRDEIIYLRSSGLFQEDFLSYLQSFRLSPKDVRVSVSAEGELAVEVEGTWLQTILWEVPLLSTVNELYLKNLQREKGLCANDLWVEGDRRLAEKIDLLLEGGVPLAIAEFGTRRRFSGPWQENVTRTLADRLGTFFVGTSNVDLARRLGVPATGTMAHEFLQAAQVLAPSLEESQVFALNQWQAEYGDKLSIALSDIYGFDAFLADFTPKLAESYAGIRHDSGDPVEAAKKLIAHYQALGINPRTKRIIFSDSLTAPIAIDLTRRFSNSIKVVCAIGTNLTNDLGLAPINIVIKMTKLNDLPVAKISDTPAKTMCRDEVFLKRLRDMVEEKLRRGAVVGRAT